MKALLRLGTLLRADIGLNEVLDGIVASVSVCTGFGTLVVHLIEEGDSYTHPVAFAGMSKEDEQHIRIHPMTIEQLYTLMRPEFCIGQSYFISHDPTVPVVGNTTDMWHPEDNLIMPLLSLQTQKLLGFLSLGKPEDGKIPTIEHTEMIELFAQQAAIAIDNTYNFQERERERVAAKRSTPSRNCCGWTSQSGSR